ncbi:flavin reductase (DIM6/NTAB) family NADH-FMN oxidoreductase RutF [Nocardiopsis mwathae]|uniref:Flavin reductase (DIM6/NTAB) family NADH-FMN oxidoreductase RutF n=1 Tax=Nocardiopsis mwathae TaxID=1472723 RepID=A0A7W9YH08_9ACTN|nr:flavin reductase family protein [Nocardiopsis mwathae]MBB6171983.1 flavin reductase (DIM6/NTAB) family NADH-FMN oxidoreductase RutF [Nocardiopsis mwathae]
MRTDLTPEDLPGRAFYRLLTAVVVPRPIAWISTTSASGVDNLAPHSFFTVSSVEPPIVQFTSVGRKDHLRNVEETGEFVVNFAPEHLQREINATATDYPPEVSEFDAVGVTREPSSAVKPPRVAASPVALECRLHSTLLFGDSTVVFGRVVHAAVDADVLTGGHPEVARLRPIARLGKDEWGTLGEVTSLPRVPYADLPVGAPEADRG